MNEEKILNEESLTPAQELYTEICATYPFFDKVEENNFHEKVSKINTSDQVEQVRLLVDALDNPHTSFYKKTEHDRKEPIPPKSELIDDIEIITIPFQSKENTPLIDLFEEYKNQSKGLILDLRDGGSGAEVVGRALIERLAKRGAYEFGTNYEVGPEGDLVQYPCILNSNNETPYEKPIVVLTSNRTFSSGERFVAALKASTNAIIIGTKTRGGSANPRAIEKEISRETYVIKLPTWRFVLKGESRPLEETKIKPDIYYDGNDPIDFSIKHIKKINKEMGGQNIESADNLLEVAKKEGERTKITENVLNTIRFDQEGLPPKGEPHVSWILKSLDPSAIISRTLVKSIGIDQENLVHNIQRHEANRGRLFSDIYENMLNDHELSLNGSKVLEVGTGPGAMCLGFHEMGASVVSLDIRDGRIFYDKKMPFLQAAGTALPFANNSFDILSLTSVLHHLPEQYRKPMLDEAFRVADTVLIQEDCLTNPVTNVVMKLVDDAVSGEIGTHSTNSYMTKQGWFEYLEKMGLKVLGTEDYYPKWLGVGMQKTFFVIKKNSTQ